MNRGLGVVTRVNEAFCLPVRPLASSASVAVEHTSSMHHAVPLPTSLNLGHFSKTPVQPIAMKPTLATMERAPAEEDDFEDGDASIDEKVDEEGVGAEDDISEFPLSPDIKARSVEVSFTDVILTHSFQTGKRVRYSAILPSAVASILSSSGRQRSYHQVKNW